jgi:hypothetical protein
MLRHSTHILSLVLVLFFVFVSSAFAQSGCDSGLLRPFDQAPVNGNPVPVSSTQPTIIEAENFDCGGEGVAYHDMTSTNDAGSTYRQSAVDIADIAGGHTVRFFDTGEWMTYQINVGTTGTYSLAISAAQNATPAQYRIEIDNNDFTGPVSVTSTGSWDVYQWFVAPNNVQLNAGTHTLKLDSVQQSYRVDQLRIVPVSTPPSTCDSGTLRPFDQAPVNGNPVLVSSTQPTIIEAENFDCGGEGVAYHDMTSTNDAGSTYRQSAVDIADIVGGHTIRFFDTSEWMTYQINVATSGTYSLAISAAQNATPAQYRIEVDNSDLTGPVGVTSTGSWDVYQWFAAPNNVQLTAGTHTLKLDSVQQSYRVDQLRIVPVSTQAQGCGTADFCLDFEASPNTQFDCIDFPCTTDQNQVRMQSLGNTITGEAQNHADPFPPGDRAADTTRIALVDGGRNGGKAIQLTTLDNDSNVHSSGSMERSEVSFLQADTGAVEGADTWWAHSVFVPLNSTLPSATDDAAGIFQFHGSGGGAPNFILSIMNQTGNNPHKVFRAYTGGNGGLDSVGTQYMYTIDGNTRIGQCIYDDFQQGVWYDFVYHIKWSSNGTGRHEIWMRKGSGPVTKVLDKSGISTLYAGDSAYLKFGVYHDPVVGANTSVIHDRIRRGSSADAVRMPDFVIDPNASVTQCAGVAP